jgi:two-component system phosphate regulon response regulator PhoB
VQDIAASDAMNPCILIADDEPDMVALLSGNLHSAGFDVLQAHDGATALEAARRHLPAAAVLDYQMPGLTGLEICRALKEDRRTERIPVLILTGRRAELDRVLAFELGVDDYITKPFSPREVVLRLRAILRRGEPVALTTSTSYASGEIAVDLVRHQVTVSGREVELTAIEFKVLAAMMQKSDQVLSREALLNSVWGVGTEVEPRTIDTHLRRLREKLGHAARQIATVRGFGYRLRAA